MSRPLLTLLVLLPERLVRADFGRAQPPAIWQKERPPVDDLGLLLDTALRLGPKPARRLFVLHSELWTQVLPLPLTAARNSSHQELTQALKFEAESFSGLSAFECELSFEALDVVGAEQNYWACSMATQQLRDAATTIEAFGGRLGGFLPVAGLPRALKLALPEEFSWSRVELWPDAVALLRKAPGSPIQRALLASAPDLDLWRAEYEQWREQVGASDHQEALFHGPSQDLDDALTGATLEDESTLQGWLAGWAEALQKRTELPLITVPKAPVSGQVLAAIALLVAALTASLCWSHARWTSGEKERFERELELAEQPAQSFASAKSKLAELSSEHAELEKRVEKLRTTLRTAHSITRTHRSRLPRLLRSLASQLAPGVEILELAHRKDGLVILGRSERPELPNQLASALARDLDGAAWHVRAADTRLVREPADDSYGFWRFEISIDEQRLPEVQAGKVATVKARAGRLRR